MTQPITRTIQIPTRKASPTAKAITKTTTTITKTIKLILTVSKASPRTRTRTATITIKRNEMITNNNQII